MAFALLTTYVALNAVDYSNRIKSATLTVQADQLDSTTFGSGGWKEVEAGLKGASLALEFVDSMVDDDLDEDLWALFATKVTFEVRPTSAAVGTGNPKYTGSVAIFDHSLGGSVGDLAGKSLTFTVSGAVTRAVA